MCGNDGLQQVSGLFFPGMDTIPLRSLHAKGGVGRTQKTTYDFNSNERVQSSECTAMVFCHGAAFVDMFSLDMLQPCLQFEVECFQVTQKSSSLLLT